MLDDERFIDLYFADESGFSLTPCVPYGWQEKGQYVGINSQRSQSVKVFGLLSKDNRFRVWCSEQSINSDMVIAFIDEFARQLRHPTVIVFDNAPIHRSQVFQNKIPLWQDQDLYIFFLPGYSPHLNLIETLWRKIKYEWLKPHHYLNWNTFTQAIDNILSNVGKTFNIRFT